MSLTKLVHHPLGRLALALSKLNGSGGNDFGSYMITPACQQRLREELSDIVFEFSRTNLSFKNTPSIKEVGKVVDEFFEIYPQKPVVRNSGGSGFHNCFWLYVTGKFLNPALIVESGVWKGQGSWILRQACPQATIHCFDLNFKRLVYKSASIHYHETDWCTFKFDAVDPANSLCFFDDHINQAKRVREAHDKGFRMLIFDDNPPAHKLYAFGLPGVPTIDMLFDACVKPGDLIEWVWKGKKKSYFYKKEDEYSAKTCIAQYAVFPDLSSVTRYGGHSFLSWVKLVDRKLIKV